MTAQKPVKEKRKSYSEEYYSWPEDTILEYFEKKVKEFRQARKETAERGKSQVNISSSQNK